MGSGIPESEEEFLPLSGLQHFVFCQRQCALIHVEEVFEENYLTLEGRLRHTSVDEAGGRIRDDVTVETAVWLRSQRLGVIGKADRVECRREGDRTVVFPVESKRARRKSLRADRVQLCAQAMALEEMRSCEVPRGALYYVQSRRRVVVDFDDGLRAATLEAARGYHALVRGRRLPRAVHDARCPACSLRAACLPMVTDDPGRMRGILSRVIEAGLRERR